ncbi:glycosyltransferase family 4 protein [Mechercharimyces sp. CAU 1602]|uniref:glycosyltransferase family 4 protein n=1 Tax=Mechercharimyces sp. CAU 1602 TaxID=2973933 RepID=UPI002161F8DF|nr:glycosyltransferase family 4 protein [Mechercharimyces sp. CAU 1602]MCS1350123.1 glycosyltransferase family 4 protein [Mechercharimyces sp. CAU 1602]
MEERQSDQADDTQQTELLSQKQPLRLLILSWEYPPRVVGGLATAVCGLAEGLVHHQVEVHVVTSMAENAPSYELRNGVHVHRLSSLFANHAGNMYDWIFHLNLDMVEEVDRLVEEGLRFDVMHTHDWLVNYAGESLRERYSFPMVTTFHQVQALRNRAAGVPEHDAGHQSELKMVQIGDHFIAVSQAISHELNEILHISPDKKVTVIPNGVPLPEEGHVTAEELKQLRASYSKPEEKLIFFVGRLVIEKGIHLLLQALPAVIEQEPNVKLLIAGEGYYDKELHALRDRLGLQEKVEFLGFIKDELRDQIYRIADLCVFPSKFEPFGIVALEALAHQTPVIVSDSGGLKEVITDRQNGVLVPYNRIDLLQESIIWALRHPREMKQMALNGYQELSHRYNWVQIAKETLAVYEQVISEKKGGGSLVR